jgi:flavorubredoxin
MAQRADANTKVDEVAEGIYRISTPLPPSALPGGFTFNQYLVVDEDPLLYHMGPRGLAPAVLGAIGRVMPVERLRWLSFAHVEADECGGLNAILAAAPRAQPLCGPLQTMSSMNDIADRAPRTIGDGETVSLGRHSVTWFDAPHVPHGWENGFLFEPATRTLLCGDLFTQGGDAPPPVVESDILGPSEAFRKPLDYHAHGPNTRAVLERLAATKPAVLACMHGSAWRGDGERLLRALADSLGA